MSQTVEDLRKQIDTLDNKVHDLLMERAELVVKIGEAKRQTNVQVVAPDREAIMIRRLLARHKGPLPKEAVVRIWRELVGAVSLLQTGLKVVVTVPEDQRGLIYWDMAKDYFSSVLPMQKVGNPMLALSLVREDQATFAVQPWPVEGDAAPWWGFLLEEAGDRAMRIMARLPLGNRSKTAVNPEHQALVVARVKFQPSGEDRSFIVLALEGNVSKARIVDKAKALDLAPLSLYSSPGPGGQGTLHLLEVDNYVAAGDEKLAQILEKLECPQGRAVCVGGYPVPPVYEDKVGKNAVDVKAP